MATPATIRDDERSIAVGAGCRRGTSSADLIALINRTLEEHHIPARAVGCICSIDARAAEPAIHDAAAHFSVPVRFFSADELSRQDAIRTDSKRVRDHMGTPSVAEAAALALAGPGGELIAARTASRQATCALAAIARS